MSTKIDDGGPAFPVAENHKIAADYEWTCGMSLRDYFAAAALTGMKAAETQIFGFSDPNSYADHAYKLADAMLAARKERP